MDNAAVAVSSTCVSSSVVSRDPTRVAFVATSHTTGDLVRRVRAEYEEMPGLSLTVPQASRLFGIEPSICGHLLEACLLAGFLRERAGRYVKPD